MYKAINQQDEIVLESVESYMRKQGNPVYRTDQEKLMAIQQARDFLYSKIVETVPRIAACIMDSQMLSTDLRVQGLYNSLSKHVMDPVFIDILMQYLRVKNNAEENAVCGALLVKILNKYIETKTKKKDAKDKEAPTFEEVSHIRTAIGKLLNSIASIVMVRCGNLTETQALSIAACIAMNNDETITEIIASDLPVTADLFDILENPTNVISAALKLEKANYTKTTANQAAFLESLKRWVYNKLNILHPVQCREVLTSIYGTPSPDVAKYYIQIKDCGTMYSNLLIVAKQMIN